MWSNHCGLIGLLKDCFQPVHIVRCLPRGFEHRGRVQVPRSCQCLLMSATSSEEVERLQKLVLHNPTTLNLLGSDADPSGAAGPGPGSAAEIAHFYIACNRCGLLPFAE